MDESIKRDILSMENEEFEVTDEPHHLALSSESPEKRIYKDSSGDKRDKLPEIR